MLKEETEDGVRYVSADREEQEAGYSPLKDKYVQLVKDYEDFRLPTKIVECASDIYMRVMKGKVMKRGRRKSMMCKCVYEAYKKHGILKDPILLSKDFGITLKQFRKAQELFYEIVFEADLQKEFPKRHLSAIELLPDIADRMGIKDPPISELSKVVDLVYEHSTLLNRTSPRNVAISVLHWYINRESNVRSYDVTQESLIIAKAKLMKNVGSIKTVMSRL